MMDFVKQKMTWDVDEGKTFTLIGTLELEIQTNVVGWRIISIVIVAS